MSLFNSIRKATIAAGASHPPPAIESHVAHLSAAAAERPATAYRGDSTITIWRFSIRGICSTLEVVSISDRIRSSTRTPISW